MNLNEAIKLNDAVPSRYAHILDDKTLAAIKLGGAGLRRIQKYRPLYAGQYSHLLPGETKES